MQFWGIMSERLNEIRNYIKSVCLVTNDFFLNEKVNRQNVRYRWNVEPYIFQGGQHQTPEEINVWAEILGNNFVSHIFLVDNLTGISYSEIIYNIINLQIPEIVADNQKQFENTVVYKQDSAPQHFTQACGLLDTVR